MIEPKALQHSLVRASVRMTPVYAEADGEAALRHRVSGLGVVVVKFLAYWDEKHLRRRALHPPKP